MGSGKEGEEDERWERGRGGRREERREGRTEERKDGRKEGRKESMNVMEWMHE